MISLISLLTALASWQHHALELLGQAAGSSAEGPVELVWTNLPTSWGVFLFLAGAAAAVYTVFAIYRRELPECPPWGKVVLASLRAICVLLLVVILLGPALVRVERRELLPTLVVLRDASLSMSTPDVRLGDEAQRLPRAEAVNALLTSAESQLPKHLADKGRVSYLDFADRVTPLEGPRPLAADGGQTDLAAALRRALAQERPAAIVLLTDGQHTGRDDPRLLAREAGERRVPIFAVGLGDPTRRQNAAVVSVMAPPRAWTGEPFEVDAALQFQGGRPQEAVVELIEQPAGEPAGGAVVQSRPLAQLADDNQSRVQLMHTAGREGEFVYQVRLRLPSDDARTEDDVATSPVVRVQSREQLRVLLVAGRPTWDYRLVQKLLARDKTIRLSCWLQTLDQERAQEGDSPIAHLPRTKEELFAYDVVLLFDPAAGEFDAAWFDLLAQFVGEHGGGLLFMAGPQATGDLLASPGGAGLGSLLPVTFGDLQAQQVTALLTMSRQAWPLKVTAAGSDHPLLRFFPDRAASVRQWESLPGVFWSFPSERPKPTAEVLLEHSDPTLRGSGGGRPLLVAGRFGGGLTVYLGMQGTWRWRQAGRDAEFFDKFWVQAVRYLAGGRSLAGNGRSHLQTERTRYEVGERILLTARLLSAAYEPLALDRVEATVARSGQPAETITLVPTAGRPGNYEAAVTARHPGTHEVRLQADLAEGAEASFQVELPDAETAAVWLNRPLLEDLASLSGGRYFDLSEITQLPAAVPDRIEHLETRTPPQPLWDNGWMFALLVGLLSSEWLLRKRFQLL